MSRATELADALEEGWLENVDLDRVDVDKLQAELRRLDRVNAELVEALTRLCRSIPTDMDMHAAGWEQVEIDEACNAYDIARAALTSATKETK